GEGAARAALEVDPGRGVADHGVADHLRTRCLEVVDAVVTVVVDDVPADHGSCRTGVGLDAGIVVAVRQVAVDNGVLRGQRDVDTGRDPGREPFVPVRRHAGHGVPRAALDADAVEVVVVRDRGADGAVGGVEEPDADGK